MTTGRAATRRRTLTPRRRRARRTATVAWRRSGAARTVERSASKRRARSVVPGPRASARATATAWRAPTGAVTTIVSSGRARMTSASRIRLARTAALARAEVATAATDPTRAWPATARRTPTAAPAATAARHRAIAGATAASSATIATHPKTCAKMTPSARIPRKAQATACIDQSSGTGCAATGNAWARGRARARSVVLFRVPRHHGLRWC